MRPVGPSRKAVTAGGGIAGLLLGVGFVFLFASPPPNAAIASQHVDVQSEIPVPVGTKHSNGVSNHASGATGSSSYADGAKAGMFHGMTLEQAIRSVEHRG